MGCAIGIDVGGTKVKIVVVDPSGKVLSQARQETNDQGGADHLVETARSLIGAMEAEIGRAGWIGVAWPGLATRDGRSIAWMMGRMSGVMRLDWTKELKRDRPVAVLNDGHAALLGEAWKGAAIGARDVVMLTLGTGVGGAIMCDGRLLRGAIG